MAKKTKLHEIIAVEGDLQKVATKIVEEATTTFSRRPEHFLEQIKTLRMFDDERQRENLSEHKAMTTTVDDKLKYVGKNLARYWDAIARKEATNQLARADVEIGGEVLIANVPGTLLLGLESRLKLVRQMAESIPTLQPGIAWHPDPDKGKGIYKAESAKRFKTEKTPISEVVVPPTKEHAAVTNTYNRDVPVGEFADTVWSSMYSPADKSELLARIDTLLRAVKKARQRANEQEVVDLRVGKVLTDYMFSPR